MPDPETFMLVAAATYKKLAVSYREKAELESDPIGRARLEGMAEGLEIAAETIGQTVLATAGG